MTQTFELVLFLLLAVAGLALLARKLAIPYPILFVVGGLLLGFVRRLPTLHLDPQLVFVLFLPPLLYPAAVFTSWRDFRANLRPILLLAIGLVLFTTVVVAWFAHRYVGIPLAAAFVLGAIISPPDAVAATAVTQSLRVPRQIITILEGESLANDATSFTTFRFAVIAAVTGSFSMADASLNFVMVVIGGIAVGVAVGWVTALVQRRLDDPAVQCTLSLLTPYVAYLAAERLGVSGVLAVVVAGLYLGWRGPEILTSRMRLVSFAFWGMLVFLLNGLLFVLIGLQLREVVQGLARHTLGQAIGFGLEIILVLILVRVVWFFVITYVPRYFSPTIRRLFPHPPWTHIAFMSWAGMRGVDSLAAAMAIPFTIGNGSPFPDRGLILFLTFSVILGTLVVQGLTLPYVIRGLKIVDDHAGEEEERLARLKANEAALERILHVAKSRSVDEGVLGRLRAEYEDRIQQLANHKHGDGEDRLSTFSPVYEELSRAALGEERKTILELRNKRVISDKVLRRIQKDIDLAEIRLEHGEIGF